MYDVTKELLHEAGIARSGETASLVQRAAPAKKITGSLLETWQKLTDPRSDLSIGFISNPLIYGSLFRHSKAFHRDVIRLIKGGFLIVLKMFPPHGEVPQQGINQNVFHDTPFRSPTDYWYEIAANPEKANEFPF